MNTEEKKRVVSAIIDQLKQEYRMSYVPEKEVLELGHNEAEIDNMRELLTEMLAIGHIYRPAIGMLALTQKNPDIRTRTVKVVITVERDGEEIRRVRYDEWLDTLLIEEIVGEISNAIGSIDEV